MVKMRKRKSPKGAIITAFIFVVIAAALLFIAPLLCNFYGDYYPFAKSAGILENNPLLASFILIPGIFQKFLANLMMKGDLMDFILAVVVAALAGIAVLIWLIHLIVLIARKRANLIWANIFFLLTNGVIAILLLGLLTKGCLLVDNRNGVSINAIDYLCGLSFSEFLKAWQPALMIAGLLALLIIGYFCAFGGAIAQMGYAGKVAKDKKRYAAERAAEDAEAKALDAKRKELDEAQAKELEDAARRGALVGSRDLDDVRRAQIMGGNGSPVFVQYIYNNSPEQRPCCAPVEPAKKEEPLNLKDIRQIIREELKASVPEAEPELAPKPIIEDEPAPQPVVLPAPVAPAPAPAPAPEPGLKAEDIRAIIKEELAAVKSPEVDNRDVNDLDPEELKEIIRKQLEM